MPMIAMTTNNSTKVKPFCKFFFINHHKKKLKSFLGLVIVRFIHAEGKKERWREGRKVLKFEPASLESYAEPGKF
jgi:hypothetical protein